MSKSLGTGINPLDVIETHGADATRYGLMKMASSQDVRFSEGAIEEGRKLANKLWNVARLILAGGRGRRRRAAAAVARGAVDPRAAAAGAARSSRRLLDAFDFSHVVAASSTASPSTTSATGTPRRSSRGSTPATPTRARRRSPRSSGC